MTKDLRIKTTNQLTNINKLLSAKIFNNIDELVNYDTLGYKLKSSVSDRLNKSMFAKVIKEMSDIELKVLGLVIGFSSKGMKAIKMYITAENTRIQRYALKQELQKRDKSLAEEK